MQLLNTELLKHPINWVIILLMLIIAGVAGHLLLSYAGISAKTQEQE
jgi:hypothetical protein